MSGFEARILPKCRTASDDVTANRDGICNLQNEDYQRTNRPSLFKS
uniref:Uncharacterized protein n=1 Tax=Meloidogyne enterolobii TaxID=390850 RepID=A0A6V7VQK3_MELEN|nr:unnamed protein product [Meloidogyne enterolobii]